MTRIELTYTGAIKPIALHQEAFGKILPALGCSAESSSAESWVACEIDAHTIRDVDRAFHGDDGSGFYGPERIVRERKVILTARWIAWPAVTVICDMFLLKSAAQGSSWTAQRWLTERVFLARAHNWSREVYYHFPFCYYFGERGKGNWCWSDRMQDPIECSQDDFRKGLENPLSIS